ncbi:MAG: aminotransferase class V-fold PLP-dependent enzyme, partial [Bacteroidota bacterium]
MLYNFNAGPGILPAEVLKEASEAVSDVNGSGWSLLEVGHREAPFVAVIEEARQLVKELMQLESNREVLFLQGGATMQFMQVPMNLLGTHQTAAYTETGTWSNKAIKEAQVFGHIEIAGSGKDSNYTQIPSVVSCSDTATYLHITTNETIAGTQWHN